MITADRHKIRAGTYWYVHNWLLKVQKVRVFKTMYGYEFSQNPSAKRGATLIYNRGHLYKSRVKAYIRLKKEIDKIASYKLLKINEIQEEVDKLLVQSNRVSGTIKRFS